MDTTPLYSAEQIVVPEELADILKLYTKAVIRAQPANILEFSAKYFEDLSRTKGRVTKSQLVKLRKQFEKLPDVTLDKLKEYCNDILVSKEVINAVTGRMSTHEWVEFVGLACTLLGQDFITSMEVVFEVFGTPKNGGELSVHRELLVKLLTFIGKHDPSIDPHFVQATSQALSAELDITYSEFSQLQAVRGLRK